MLVVFASAFGTGHLGALFLPAATVQSERRHAVARPGRQYLFIYVGSSRCGPSNAPGLADAVRELWQIVKARAERDSVGFVAIGIAREFDPRDGLNHLASVGDFDELAVGQGALNQAAAHFVSVTHVGVGATPQLIVVSRELHASPAGVDAASFEERVLLRKVGVQEIRNWRDLGGPFPTGGLRSKNGEIAHGDPVGTTKSEVQ